LFDFSLPVGEGDFLFVRRGRRRVEKCGLNLGFQGSQASQAFGDGLCLLEESLRFGFEFGILGSQALQFRLEYFAVRTDLGEALGFGFIEIGQGFLSCRLNLRFG